MTNPAPKKEDGDRDRFVAYLRETENVLYRTIGENVPTRDETHDFDYLLQDSSNNLLALEVTWLTDPPELIAESMRNVILEMLAPLRAATGLPGSFVVDVPYDPQLFCSSKGALISKSRILGTQLRSDILFAAQTYDVPKTISTEIGFFTIRRLGDGDGISITSGAPRFNTFQNEWAYFSKCAAELIPRKDLQLDSDATRRVLVVGNTCYMASNEAIAGAFTQFLNGAKLTNINEIYVDFSVNEFQRLY